MFSKIGLFEEIPYYRASKTGLYLGLFEEIPCYRASKTGLDLGNYGPKRCVLRKAGQIAVTSVR